MAANIEELVYETALKSLDRQEEQVVQLRARTGMLLAAASLGGSKVSRNMGASSKRSAIAATCVLVTMREEGRGRASGATVSARVYMVMTFREGKILRYQEFYDERLALEAAGWRE
jgi:hypothetical protein